MSSLNGTLLILFGKDEEVDNINYIIDMMEALKKLRTVAEKFDNEPIKEQDCDNIDGCEIVSGFIKEANN